MCDGNAGSDLPSEETASIIARLESAGLTVKHYTGTTKNNYFIEVTASYELLCVIAEATAFKVQIDGTRGLDTQKVSVKKGWFGGTTAYSRLLDKEGFAYAAFPGRLDEAQEAEHGLYFAKERFPMDGSIQPFVKGTRKSQLFSSGQRQQLIREAIEQGPELDLTPLANGGAGLGLDSAVYEYSLREQKKVREAESVGQSDLMRMLKDPIEVLFKDLDDDDAAEAIAKGLVVLNTEQVTCVKDFFPTHDQRELKWLKKSWSAPKILLRPFKTLDVRQWWSLFNQPIHEIRRYYGEKIAMYYAFLQIYTKQLVWPAMVGIMCMFGHIGTGVEGNPLTSVYSLFVAMWAIWLLAVWEQKENELKFMWGMEDFEETEEPRKEFKEVAVDADVDWIGLVKDPFTGELELTYKRQWPRVKRMIIAWGVIGVFTFIVVNVCLVCMWIKLTGDPIEGADGEPNLDADKNLEYAPVA